MYNKQEEKGDVRTQRELEEVETQEDATHKPVRK